MRRETHDDLRRRALQQRPILCSRCGPGNDRARSSAPFALSAFHNTPLREYAPDREGTAMGWDWLSRALGIDQLLRKLSTDQDCLVLLVIVALFAFITGFFLGLEK